jgi:hypothetical protein
MSNRSPYRLGVPAAIATVPLSMALLTTLSGSRVRTAASAGVNKAAVGWVVNILHKENV